MQQNFRAVLPEQAGITDELDGISGALLGVQQNRLACDGDPSHSGSGSVCTLDAGLFPAPFVFLPAFFERTPEQGNQSAIGMGLGILGSMAMALE